MATLTPPEAPLAEDVNFEKLAKHFEMTGGMIKNAIVRAAYMSCDIGQPINQKRLEESCLDEYQAAGKVARDPSALPPPRIVIPDGAVELPPDWQDKGIPPELLVKAGVGDADLGKNLKNALRPAPGHGDDAPRPKVRPIPGLVDDYPIPSGAREE
jgi:hypothetical protein